MQVLQTISDALGELGYKFERATLDDGTEQFTIVVDESEGLEVNGFLYHTEDGAYFRLMGYVDELSEDGALEQLSQLLALNGDLPTGAFCMDPQEHVIYITVNLPAAELNTDLLGYMIDFLFWAQDFYYDELFPEENGGNGLAEG